MRTMLRKEVKVGETRKAKPNHLPEHLASVLHPRGLHRVPFSYSSLFALVLIIRVSVQEEKAVGYSPPGE